MFIYYTKSDELHLLLNKAYDMAVKMKLVTDDVLTKKKEISFVQNAILRNCGDYDPIEWVKIAADEDIRWLRNIGVQREVIIKIARSILNGEEVKGEELC